MPTFIASPLDNFKAKISVSDNHHSYRRDLEVYDIEGYHTEQYDGIDGFIAVEPGQKYRISFKCPSPNFVGEDEDHCYWHVKVYIDGRHVDNMENYCRNGDYLREQVNMRGVKVDSTSVDGKKGTALKLFEFKKPDFVDEAISVTPEELGTIKLKFHRLALIEAHLYDGYFGISRERTYGKGPTGVKEVPKPMEQWLETTTIFSDPVPLHGKEMYGAASSTLKGHIHEADKVEPFYEIVFRYRSLNWLQQKRIAPPNAY